MEDEGKLPIGSRFFKVLIPGFEQALRLPPIISMTLSNGEIPEAAILVSRRGSWRVSVGKCSNCLTFNGEGWDSFIQFHDLSVGNFLVFEHNGEMHFNTLVFDSTTCEKQFPITSKNVKAKTSNDQNHRVVKGIKRKHQKKGKRNGTATFHQQKNAHFQITLHHYSVKFDFLYIPAKFFTSNDLSDKKAVTLINPWGHTWQVSLKRHSNGRRHRNVMTRGWKKFVKANKLKEGDVCVFELNSSLGGSDNAVMNVQFFS